MTTFKPIEGHPRTPGVKIRRTPSGPQWSSKSQFVTVGIGQVEKPLAPFGVARRGIRRVAGGDKTGIERVEVRYVEYQSAPPGPLALGRLGDQVDEIAAGAKTAKCRILTAKPQFKPKQAVKPDGAAHVVRGERDGVDAFDHGDRLNSREPPIIERSSRAPPCAALHQKSASKDLPKRAPSRRGPAGSLRLPSCNPVEPASERGR